MSTQQPEKYENLAEKLEALQITRVMNLRESFPCTTGTHGPDESHCLNLAYVGVLDYDPKLFCWTMVATCKECIAKMGAMYDDTPGEKP